MDKSEALKDAMEYAELVRKELAPSEIFLFGSYAHGTPHEWSDIDIAVVVDHFEGNTLDTAAHLWTLRRNIKETLIYTAFPKMCGVAAPGRKRPEVF